MLSTRSPLAGMPAALTPYDAGMAAVGNLQTPGWSGLRELSASADPIELPLVTGAGRSGTHSVAEYLNHEASTPAVRERYTHATCHVACPTHPYSSHGTQVHEGARLDHVSVGWNFAGAGAQPQGSFPMEKPRDEQMKRRGVVFQPVVHLVREPLSSIHALAGCLCPGNAMANRRLAYLDNASYEYASRCLDNNTWLNAVLRRAQPSRLAMATAYWVSWNKLAASNARARHHLETLDGNQLVADLGRSAGGRRLPAFDVHKSSVPHTGGRLSCVRCGGKSARSWPMSALSLLWSLVTRTRTPLDTTTHSCGRLGASRSTQPCTATREYGRQSRRRSSRQLCGPSGLSLLHFKAGIMILCEVQLLEA